MPGAPRHGRSRPRVEEYRPTVEQMQVMLTRIMADLAALHECLEMYEQDRVAVEGHLEDADEQWWDDDDELPPAGPHTETLVGVAAVQADQALSLPKTEDLTLPAPAGAQWPHVQ